MQKSNAPDLKICVRKNQNFLQPFSLEKIIASCINAGASLKTATKIASEVSKQSYDGMPTAEIKKIVYRSLRKIDSQVAENYKYRIQLKVRTSETTLAAFKPEKIIKSLVKETNLDRSLAEKIARAVEKELSRMKLNYVTAPLIREIVNVKLLEHGLENARARYTRLGMPVYDVKKLIERRVSNSTPYNPEIIHKLMADQISKEYTLLNVLPVELADAHMGGQIHVHDLHYFPTRIYSFSHDMRFFLRRGLKVDGTGRYAAAAGPAKKPASAFMHAVKVLAAGQVDCSGPQGLNYFNVYMAPYVRGLSFREVSQLVQMFLYEASQVYVTRGGLPLYSSIDCCSVVPAHFAGVPAVQPGGVVRDSVTYSDYSDEVRGLFNAILDVYVAGDVNGRSFVYPQLNVHLTPSGRLDFRGVGARVSELVLRNRNPYFILDRGEALASYLSGAFKVPLSQKAGDLSRGLVRGGVLQVVSVNLPQAAYRANGDDATLLDLVGEGINKARLVLLLKRRIVEKNVSNKTMQFLTQESDGRSYFDLREQGCLVGFVGLNEMIKVHTGEELHDSKNAAQFGLRFVKDMQKRILEIRRDSGFNFMLCGGFDGDYSVHLARVDSEKYAPRVFLNLCDSYTKSFHLNPSARVSLADRLSLEGRFHKLLDGGALFDLPVAPEVSKNDVLGLLDLVSSKTEIRYSRFVMQNGKSK